MSISDAMGDSWTHIQNLRLHASFMRREFVNQNIAEHLELAAAHIEALRSRLNAASPSVTEQEK